MATATTGVSDIVALALGEAGAVRDAPPTPPSRWQQMFGRGRRVEDDVEDETCARTCTEEVVAGLRPEELADDSHRSISGCTGVASPKVQITAKPSVSGKLSHRALNESWQGLEHVAWPDAHEVEGVVDIDRWISDVRRESERITAAAFSDTPRAHATSTEATAPPRAVNAGAKAQAAHYEDKVESDGTMDLNGDITDGYHTSALDYYSQIRSGACTGSASTSPETVVASSCSPSSCGTGPSVPSSPSGDGQGLQGIASSIGPNPWQLRTPEPVPGRARSPVASGSCARAVSSTKAADLVRSGPNAGAGADVEAGGRNEQAHESLVEARDFLQAWLRVDDEASRIKKRVAPASQSRHKTHAAPVMRNGTSQKRKIQTKEQKQVRGTREGSCNQENRWQKGNNTPQHDPRVAMEQRHAAVRKLRAERIRRQLAREQERKQEQERECQQEQKSKHEGRCRQRPCTIEHRQHVSRQRSKMDVRTSLQGLPDPPVPKGASGPDGTISGKETRNVTQSGTSSGTASPRCRAELMLLHERLAVERSELHAIEQRVEQERERRQGRRLRSEIQRVREQQRELRREQQQAQIEARERSRVEECRTKRAAARLLLRLAEMERHFLFSAARRRMRQWREFCERERRQTRALLRRVFSGWVTEWNATRERIRRAYETHVWRMLSAHFVALRSYSFARRRERETLAWKRQLRAEREADQKALFHASVRLKRRCFVAWRGAAARSAVLRREERLQRVMRDRVETRLRALAKRLTPEPEAEPAMDSEGGTPLSASSPTQSQAAELLQLQIPVWRPSCSGEGETSRVKEPPPATVALQDKAQGTPDPNSTTSEGPTSCTMLTSTPKRSPMLVQRSTSKSTPRTPSRFAPFDAMEARAAERRARREQLRRQYEEKAERAAAARLAAAQHEADELARQEREKAQARAAEQEERERIAKQMAHKRWLADMHYKRTLLSRAGFAPLKRNWREAQLSHAKAQVLYLENMQRSALLAWSEQARRARRGRREVELAKRRCADRHRAAVLRRRAWTVWLRTHRSLRAQQETAMQQWRLHLLQRTWGAWRTMLMERRALHRRLQQLADDHRSNASCRNVFRAWQGALGALRAERKAELERSEMWRLAQGWLSEQT